VRALTEIARERDVGRLLARLEAGGGGVAEVRAVWRSLAAGVWSSGAAEAGRVARVAAAARGLSADPGVAGAIAGDVRGVGAGLAVAAMRAGEKERTVAFEGVWRAAGSFGAAEADARAAGPRLLYNWRLMAARAAVEAVEVGAAKEAQGAAVAAALAPLEEAARLAGVSDRPEVSGVLKGLTRSADPNGKSFTPSDAGPAAGDPAVKSRMGWDEGSEAAGGVVVYRGKRQVLTFATVVVDGQEVLVQTREVTAGLVAEVLADIGGDAPWSGDPAGTMTLLPMPSGRDEPRQGPRVWTSENGRDIVAVRVEASRARPTWYGWFPWNTTMDGKPAAFPWLPEGVRLTPPTLDCPMQQVTPEAAVLVARRLGCRLPTVGEWAAARALSPPGETPNLRDASWLALRNVYVPALDAWNRTPANGAKQITAQLPSGGVFLPRGRSVDPMRDDAAGAENDGDPLLRSAKGEAGEAGVRDLIGNVAEYVLADAAGRARVEQVPAACGANDAFGLFASGKEHGYGMLRVVGGSALSPPDPVGYRPEDPQEIPATAPTGYSDVGFRLAITKGDGTVGRTPRERGLSVLEKRARVLGVE
jgi:formylglycine-generating enzyme required for sulfatase activity